MPTYAAKSTSTAKPVAGASHPALSLTYNSFPKAVQGLFCPPANSTPQTRLGWITGFLDSAERTLKASRNYARMLEAIEILSPMVKEKSPTGRMSSTEINLTKRQAQKIIATLSDISPSWNYLSSDRELIQQAKVLSQLFAGIWQHPRSRTRELLTELFQYCVVGEGYLSATWANDIYSRMRGDLGLNMKSYPVDEIFHSQMTSDRDIQKCYCAGMVNDLPITNAIMLYPEHAQFLVSEAQPVTLLGRVGKKLKSIFQSPALQASLEDQQKYYGNAGGTFESPMTSTLQDDRSVAIYDLYIQDCSVNMSNSRLAMGKFGTPGYYEVPFVGEMIPDGTKKPNGTDNLRAAREDECLIYPYRRRIICTKQHIIYDGPSPWSHGKVPLTRFVLDAWNWDEVGNPIVMEGAGINTTIESIFRGVEDMINLRLDPPMKLPKSLGKTTTDGIRLREPGRHLRVDPFESTKVDTLHPAQMLQIEPQIVAFMQLAQQQSDHLMGEADMRSLAQAAQIPSAETVDRFLQQVSPLATMMSTKIEASFMQHGELVKNLLLQFASASYRYQILGRDGWTQEDFDFKPGELIPSGMDIDRSTIEGASEYGNRFIFSITPGSAYKITDQARQLMILQLWRDGRFPIGPWTVAKIMNLDIGPAPKEAANEVDQWLYFQQMMSQFSASMQAQASLIMAQAQIQAQRMAMAQQGQDMMAGMGALMGGGGYNTSPPAQGEGGTGNPVGRPPSGNEAPHIEQKDGGARTTVAES